MSENWRTVKLGSLGEFRNGVNFSREEEGPGIPILKVKDFGNRVLAPTHGLDELSLKLSQLPPDQLLREGDIVIIRSNGNSALVGRSFVYHQSQRPTTFSGFCIRFRPNPSLVDPTYAAYFLRSPLVRQRFSAFGSGTGIQNLSQTILSEVPILLPSKREQQDIARTLCALDDKIALNHSVNETLEDMARTIFKSWFVDFEPVRAKVDGRQPFGMDAPTASLFSDSFEDSPIGKIPRGWNTGKVDDLIDLNRGTLSPGKHPDESFDHYSIPAFDEGRWPAEEFGYQIKSNKTIVPKDAVLLSKLNPRIPRIWMPTITQARRSIASTEFLVATPKERVSREYVFSLFTSQDFLDVLVTLVTGTSGSHQRVQPHSLLTMQQIIPPPRILENFTQIVNRLLSKVEANLVESRALISIRDGLLPKLMSGEVSLRNAEEMATPS
jgi:type I restriction enzyme, S subunit